MADLRIVDAPVLLQESITDDVKMPTGGLGNFSIRLGDIVWYVVTKEQLANKNYVDLSSKGVKDSLDEHIADKNNPHNVTKAQVGLGNVDNTADVDKPVSNATKSAIITATTDMATKAYVGSKDGDLATLLTTDKTSLVKAINEVVSVKANKATKLVGYGISDAYTKSEIDTNYGGVKTLYDKNVEAGAGANGWTALLIKDASGKTQQEINDKQPVINANLLGIIAGNDITTPLSNFLNDSVNSQMYLPSGEYTVSNKITVNATIPKKIICQQGAVIKANLLANTNLFDCYSYFDHDNLTIDFNNSYCKNGFNYRASVGTARFDNLTIKNLNDTASNYGTNLVYIDSSNVIDIGKVTFSNCKKLGNGTITDANGSLQCLYVSGTSTTPRGGVIDTIEITDVHNVNSGGSVIIEDTAGFYVGINGNSIPLTVRRIVGKEFGKRLVKLQSSDVSIDYIYGLSETGDSLSVIGVLSEPNLFVSYRNKIGTVIARGTMDYAVADAAESTEFKSVDISVYGSNTLNNGTVQFGFFAGNGSKKLRVGKLKSVAKRPLALSPTNPSLSVSDLVIDDAELEIYGNGAQFINIPGNASITTGAISDISIKKLTLNVKQTNSTSLLATFNTQLNYANITIDRLLVRDSVSTDASRKFDFGTYYYINGLTINEIVYSSTNALTSKTSDLFTLNNCQNVSIGRVVGLPACNRGVILVGCTDVNVSKDMRLDTAGVGAIVVTGASTKISVNNPALIVYNAATNLAEVKFSRGTTAQRPLRAEVGYQYFDTTINKPIFCKTATVFAADGTVSTVVVWIDSAGTVV